MELPNMIDEYVKKYDEVFSLRNKILYELNIDLRYATEFGKILFIDENWRTNITEMIMQCDYYVRFKDKEYFLWLIWRTKQYTAFLDWLTQTLYVFPNKKRKASINFKYWLCYVIILYLYL